MQVLLKACLHLVTNVYRLKMKVTGVDYQFDGTKLTLYYTSDVRVDYRELVRDLFAKFHTRIWMKKTNQCKTFVPHQFATQALTTGNIM